MVDHHATPRALPCGCARRDVHRPCRRPDASRVTGQCSVSRAPLTSCRKQCSDSRAPLSEVSWPGTDADPRVRGHARRLTFGSGRPAVTPCSVELVRTVTKRRWRVALDVAIGLFLAFTVVAGTLETRSYWELAAGLAVVLGSVATARRHPAVSLGIALA